MGEAKGKTNPRIMIIQRLDFDGLGLKMRSPLER
jgi:hypothetical protein